MTYKLCTSSMLTLNYCLLKREQHTSFARGPCWHWTIIYSKESEIKPLYVVLANIELLFTQNRTSYKLCTWFWWQWTIVYSKESDIQGFHVVFVILNYCLLKGERHTTFASGSCWNCTTVNQKRATFKLHACVEF